MALYEYACTDCGRRFEEVVIGRRLPSCPACRSRRVSKLLSVFAVGSDGSPRRIQDGGEAPCGSCGDPRGPGACSRD